MTLIGSGAAGDVYHALYASTGVACKRLRFSKEAANRAMQVLVEECRLALKLRHPNVARGMAYLHSHRVIHRDLKPGNVLLKLPMMTAKVADFGASRENMQPAPSAGLLAGAFSLERASAAMTMSMAGTPVYMAPEVLRQDRYGKPCDVWSFGGLLVHIATRRPPFAALLESGHLSPLDLLNKVTKGEMRPTSNPGGQPGALCFAPAEWPQAVAQLAEACFAFDPLERPTFEEAADESKEPKVFSACSARSAFSEPV
ncbi:hypothetical protein EMIHUDRAFT_225324 [Emiliania huxleyi CCMP1516]|uniref:Protein kinase domain-containing protein n=2 Tax=Emiliania huxleyi TaxID=2903 RepID=A0A0D3KNZ4_EMIH1|nr:hypothetical protein EMIHUDRAFT_225324 [Emiliania huxleyi CCMP1516]EOD37479.1 hypothetical protein EMIHUDRAFT_225324 [Emiliania huxleyi CCMP1516]|eukprot:XP_005789908.1 hypothetical protein EMIHUDRAFT_225324 [Emiliania huxleyi CCMP1516]